MSWQAGVDGDRQADRQVVRQSYSYSYSKQETDSTAVGRETDTKPDRQKSRQPGGSHPVSCSRVIIEANVLMRLEWCVVLWRLLSYGEHYNVLHIPLAERERGSTSPPPHLLPACSSDVLSTFFYLWHIVGCFSQTAQKTPDCSLWKILKHKSYVINTHTVALLTNIRENI